MNLRTKGPVGFESVCGPAPPRRRKRDADAGSTPCVLESVASGIHIMQDRITRSRLAGAPPDAQRSPGVADIQLLELLRAAGRITREQTCVKRSRPAIERAGRRIGGR